MFDKSTTPFVRWSAGALPGGDKIATLPVITIDEFIEAITGNDHTPYREDVAGKKYNPGIFNTNETVFLDIDHIDDYFEEIWNALDDIMADCPFIAMVKQSRSKSLHFICVGHWNNIDEHAERDMFYLACVAKSILIRTGIDLRDEEKALDIHTKSSDQRLFVYNPSLHPYKVNKYIMEVSINDKAFAEYPMLRPAKSTPMVSVEEYDGVFDAVVREDKDKITLDRTFCVCGYYGNDARWRVANAVAYLCHGNIEAAKSVIYNNFSNYSDFSFASIGKGTNHNVLNWVINNLQVKYGGDCGGYLTDKIDEIMHFVKLHPRTLLVAPTGTGKTTLVNGMEGFEGLAKRLNAVVVTPFNSMVHLYSNITIIKSNGTTGANLEDYRSDEPCVIIWDQVNKLIKRIKEDNRTVIVDESHTLFIDRNYRDSAVILMNHLKEVKNVICITATPTGEEQELNLDKLEYRSHKGIVSTTIRVTESNAGICMLGDVIYHHNRNDYDRIVVFSDLYTRRLHENLDVRIIPHAFIHSKNMNGEDFKALRESEMLTEKITLCTSLAYNGLNFRNENERVLVIMDVHEGDTLASNIIQCVGRLRRSAVVLKMYYVPMGERSTIDQRKLKVDLVTDNRIDDMLVSIDKRLIHEENVAAYKSIERYTLEHSTMECIKKELKDTGYFTIREVYDEEGKEPINAQLLLQEKRKMEAIWMEGFLNGTQTEDEDVRGNEYFLAVDRLWHSLVWKYAMRADMVRDMLRNQQGNKLVSTLFEELRKKCQLNTYTDEEFNRMYHTLETWIKDYKDELGSVVVKQFKSNLRDMKKWRDHYVGDGKDIAVGDMVRMISVTDGDLCEAIANKHEIRSKAGRMSGHKKSVYRCQDGFEGTKQEIAEHLGISIDGVKKQIQRGLTVKV